MEAVPQLGMGGALIRSVVASGDPSRGGRVILGKRIQEVFDRVSESPSVETALRSGIGAALLRGILPPGGPSQQDKLILERRIREALEAAPGRSIKGGSAPSDRPGESRLKDEI